MQSAVAEQQAENAGKAAATDETAAPVGDAIGFKRVTIAQSRTIRNLMTEVESRTGKSGVEALIAALQQVAGTVPA